MTAVASPPSVQSGSRLGWYDSGNGRQGALSSVNADEVSRMFMPRKHVQRSNSSSSLGSSSSASTVSAAPQDSHAEQGSDSESGTWSSKKKPSRSPWPSSKSEPVSGVTNTRSQAVSAFSSGPTASSTMSAIHQPSSIVPSQHTPQQNGVRAPNGQSSEPPAILALMPINGTFEKKQINVPFYPEVLRIGRQTNAKTVPTPINGFFDSKVLSRQHAEIWADKTGKIWIRDVKSSNGTFVNGQRLSPENRESEPHELRENDTLELGIDIVSEDQNTIVHHKVSAKVEHAGIYGTTPNILDLNFGDLDPASGGGLLPSPLSQPLSHLRGRANSNLSNRSAPSAASSQLNALHQRQMNYWNSPVSIEQVVKRLTGELKQAKQQSQDLRQTDEFLTTIMKPGYAEKEKAMKPPPLETGASRQMNGRPKMPRVDSFSRFSDPPAPPPQQPLPEKPDAPLRSGSDAFSPLKRSETEKPKAIPTTSPVSRDSSQILSLIEALSSAKREIDTQGARVKELENLLRQERAAREWAEERARKLETHSALGNRDVRTENGLDSSLEKEPETKTERQYLEPTAESNGSILPSEIPTPSGASKADPSAEVDTIQLQRRLETMMKEMEEMRQQMASFKERAEKAEDETAQSRKSLGEMIETLRRERAEKASATGSGSRSDTHGHDGHEPTSALSTTFSASDEDGTAQSKTRGSPMQCFDPGASSQNKDIDAAATAFATQRQRHNFLEEASPYASMFGVVLLGVGLMAYLNGWQKMDK